jgi:23S rRNA G2445 N2-methylase RlmL
MESWLYEQRPALDIWRPLNSVESLPEFPTVTWKFFKTKLNVQRETVKARAIEWDKKGVEVLVANLEHAEKSWPSIAGRWETSGTDFLEDKCPSDAKNIFVPLNPPYGLRLDGEDTQDLYLKLGTWLHEAFAPEQRRFGFVLLADSKAFHAFEKGVGQKHVKGILSFTQGGQHIRCVSFDIPAQ